MANMVDRPSGAAPTTPGKSVDTKAPGWGQIFGANPRGARGDGYRWNWHLRYTCVYRNTVDRTLTLTEWPFGDLYKLMEARLGVIIVKTFNELMDYVSNLKDVLQDSLVWEDNFVWITLNLL